MKMTSISYNLCSSYILPLTTLLLFLTVRTNAASTTQRINHEGSTSSYNTHTYYSRHKPVSAKLSFLSSETGHRVGSNQHSQTMTRDGPILLQHVYGLEKLRRFNTERIPERVVHARGMAVMGHFTSSVNLKPLTASDIFSSPGKKTPVVVRFSTVIHGKHSPETLRDPRGFAIKFKSETDGNWDLVGNNLPVFFIRDHLKFPDLVHSLKPDPVTNVQDPNRFFDFFAALGGMATNMLTFLYSDLGIPRSYRFMDGNSVHAYKLVNSEGKVTYVKFRWIAQSGVQNLTRAEAAKIQAENFSHATMDMNEAIMRGNFPRWTLQVQKMDIDEVDGQEFYPLDATKVWPERDFPFMDVGVLELNELPPNFHMGSEQSAFDPGNFPPGRIEPSEDKLLQGRLVSYHESQTHRHGSNVFQYLPINRARSPIRNYNQDGVMAFEHAWSGSINYEPSMGESRLKGQLYEEDRSFLYSRRRWCGATVQRSIEKTMDFAQAGELFRSFSKKDRDNLIGNIVADLMKVRSKKIRNTMCSHFYKAEPEYGRRVCEGVRCNINVCMKMAARLRD